MAMELMIGRVIKPHGIRGEVSVEATTDEPQVRFAVGEVLHGRQGTRTRDMTIMAARPHQGRLLLTFAEVPDRTAAESLRGMKFFSPPLAADGDDDGFYDHELEGLVVVHDGNRIGTITGVTHTTNRALLTVTLSGGKDTLVPFVHDIVPDVDLAAGTVTITPPEGLLEL